MARTEELMKLAEAASNEDDDAMVELQFEGPTIKQLVELCRLQNEALVDMRDEFRGYDLPYGSKSYTSGNEAIAAFNRFEKGGE